MEEEEKSNEEAGGGDDRGWCEVKKTGFIGQRKCPFCGLAFPSKHRSNPRFSIQSNVGEGSSTSHEGWRNSAIRSESNSGSSISLAKESDDRMGHLERRVNNRETDNTMTCTNAEYKSKEGPVNLYSDKPLKFKWGDIEDDGEFDEPLDSGNTLLQSNVGEESSTCHDEWRNFPVHSEINSGGSMSLAKEPDDGMRHLERRVANVESDNTMTCTNAEDRFKEGPVNFYSDKPPNIKLGDTKDDDDLDEHLGYEKIHPASQEEKCESISDNVEQLPVGMLSSESLQENGKRKVNEISIVDMVSSISALGEMTLKDVKSLSETDHKPLQSSCSKAGDDLMSNTSHTEIFVASSVSNVHDAPASNEVSATSAPPQGSTMCANRSSDHLDASDDASKTANVESQKCPGDIIGGDVVSLKGQLMSAFGEGEPGESKERFRERLWCFLFENLNRAVDELYLLCELECDVEQMAEAILVLEEAGSDFRELKSRVEGFDKLKRTSSQLSLDGGPLNMKSGHRRSHALSWEVRRMTTSPRRAEILSSSLEAFKKIQQGSAIKQTTQNPRVLRPSSTLRYSRGHNQNEETNRLSKRSTTQSGRLPLQYRPVSESVPSHLAFKDYHVAKRDKLLGESKSEKVARSSDTVKRIGTGTDKEKEKERRSTPSWKSMNAWKEKRNWEDILSIPLRGSSRASHSPGMSRRSADQARVLHDKLMSPEKKKKDPLDMKREVEEKHARASRIRSEQENEKIQKLQRTSEKLNRVNERQAVRSMKLREELVARHQRSESRHEAHLAQVVRRAGDESSKVNEVRFITSLNEENKKLMIKQKHEDSELRRAEKLQVIRTKQKEDLAREEAVLERRKLIEAEKLQRLVENQKKKEEALVRREEERKASSAVREARAIENQRRKEVRAKAQQEEAELLAQKLAEKLSESESRRKFYLYQIRDRASMDFRDQSSPSVRRGSSKENNAKLLSGNSVDDFQINCNSGVMGQALGVGDAVAQQSLKRRIKKIRQRLMALKHDFSEPPVGAEMAGSGYKTQVGVARAKIGRWLQDLQRLRQARKEGAPKIGPIIGDVIKFLEGNDPGLHASRQAGLLDFIANTLPASHTSKPEACEITTSLLRLLKVVLSVPANRRYFLAQNLLPPIIPMLSAALENYNKIAASSNPPVTSTLDSKRAVTDNLEFTEVLEGFLWVVGTVIGLNCYDQRQIQMQESLVELVVAYQIVHRLHDLFAICHQPKLEGSPFPSPILFSLKLLAVLISRSGVVSSNKWDCYQSECTVSHKKQETQPADVGESQNANVSSQAATSSVDILSGTTTPGPNEGSKDHVTEPLVEVVNSGESFGEAQKGQVEEDAGTSSSPKNGSGKACNSFVLQNSNVPSSGAMSVHAKNENSQGVIMKPAVQFLFSALMDTGLVNMLSLLAAVLFQANNKTSSEQISFILPSNFEEVASGVLKVLNSLALLNVSLLQRILAKPDLQTEFFHLMSFLLSHCTKNWKAATDQVGLLLLDTLFLLGYFAVRHPQNQAVLTWGKSPTILHKVCELPFEFFSDPQLTPILAGTLVSACYECEQNLGVVQHEISMDMLLFLLKSCRQEMSPTQSDPCPSESNMVAEDSCDGNQSASEPRKSQNELLVRSGRNNVGGSRPSLGKGGLGNNGKASKGRNQRESKGGKICDDCSLKHNVPITISTRFMAHRRFKSSFLDEVEEFFSAFSSNMQVASI